MPPRRSNAQTTLDAAEEEVEATAALLFQSLPGAIRAAARFVSPSRADFDMRGFAISFLTLARVASPPNSFLADIETEAIQFNLERCQQSVTDTHAWVGRPVRTSRS